MADFIFIFLTKKTHKISIDNKMIRNIKLSPCKKKMQIQYQVNAVWFFAISMFLNPERKKSTIDQECFQTEVNDSNAVQFRNHLFKDSHKYLVLHLKPFTLILLHSIIQSCTNDQQSRSAKTTHNNNNNNNNNSVCQYFGGQSKKGFGFWLSSHWSIVSHASAVYQLWLENLEWNSGKIQRGGDNQYHAPHHQILCNLSAEMENKEQKKKGEGTDPKKGREIMAYEWGMGLGKKKIWK